MTNAVNHAKNYRFTIGLCLVPTVIALLTACGSNEASVESVVGLKLPTAIIGERTADCITGTISADGKSATLTIDRENELAQGTLTGVTPGSVIVTIEFKCFDVSVAQASLTMNVVDGQTSQVAFTDSDFTIGLVWDVTKWNEGRWAP